MMANFMASLMATVHSNEQDAEPVLEGIEVAAKSQELEMIHRPERLERTDRPERADRSERLDRTDRSLVGRANIDSADLEAESWAGPVRSRKRRGRCRPNGNLNARTSSMRRALSRRHSIGLQRMV